MGLITKVMSFVFGGGRNVIAETAEVFRPNAENEAQRGAQYQGAALQQFGKEFEGDNRGRFDRLIDGVNRLPRPTLAIGTIALFISAMSNPAWFGERMEALAKVPEPMWWLLGAIVTFYFGARHQVKGQAFQRSIAGTLARTMPAAGSAEAVERPPGATTPRVADTDTDAQATEDATEPEDNAALAAWRKMERKSR